MKDLCFIDVVMVLSSDLRKGLDPDGEFLHEKKMSRISSVCQVKEKTCPEGKIVHFRNHSASSSYFSNLFF